MLVPCPRLGTALFFSTLGLTICWQMALSPESKEKASFSTPYSLYQFVTCVFDFFGAPATAVPRGLDAAAAQDPGAPADG